MWVSGEIHASESAAALLAVLTPVERWRTAKVTREDYRAHGTLNLWLRAPRAAWRLIGKGNGRYLVYGNLTQGAAAGKAVVAKMSQALRAAGIEHRFEVQLCPDDGA